MTPDGRLYSSKERAENPSGNAMLYAFDAQTGKGTVLERQDDAGIHALQRSGDLGGQVYVVTHDSTVYAFGLGRE